MDALSGKVVQVYRGHLVRDVAGNQLSLCQGRACLKRIYAVGPKNLEWYYSLGHACAARYERMS
jgi:hypothetical protein